MIDLRHGDCLDLLKTIPDDSVDFVCSDMPYGTTKCKWDQVIDLNLLWPELIRVTKDTTAIVLFAQTPFDKVLGASNLSMLRYEWIWEKSNATGHLNAKKMPMKSHENLLVFYKKLPTYRPQKTTGHVRKVSTKTHDKTDCYGSQSDFKTYDSTERYPRSVLKYPSDKYTNNLHPTQKPVGLIEYLVNTYTNVGEVVLDFCMGSGTTAEASIKLGRSFIGFEKDEHYFNVSINRVDKLTISLDQGN